jgi:hypothetical protein
MPNRSLKSVAPRKLKRFKGGTFTRHDYMHMNDLFNDSFEEINRPMRALGRRKEQRGQTKR